ncbi:Fungalysin metallopeptidase-domain-containing protein [Mycena alexandri]|uniref:Extracellular metalloproteinase n=1 Tax=Mycena alexandri TaxID=1745969 RepID=A0AAD6SIS0_9AGAR|nr:Fungalysin metallopeptidase-domain-containing protein [Mycena alexandri]
MVALNKFFVSVVLAVMCTAAGALAVPQPAPASRKHATHRLRVVGRGLQLDTFHPVSTYETFGAGIDHGMSKRADASLEERALAFVQAHLGVAADAVAFRSGFAGEACDHAFLRQMTDGIPVANAVANIAFNKNDKVVALGSSFVKPSSVAPSTPTIPLDDAIRTAEAALEGTFNGHPATLEFLAREDGSLALTRVMQIQNEETGVWVEAFVDAHSGELLSITDFVTKAQYIVLPIQKEILTQGFELLIDPQDPLGASPDGWHSDGTTNTTTTAGNNAIAFKGTQANLTSESAPGSNWYHYKQDVTVAPTTQVNVDAARVNAFYIVNTIHDLSYRYGFTEAAFNFQNNNFGKGGVGNDRVTISVQSTAGVDNSDFSTPPDGQSGAMRMFLWDLTSPERDGALENDIVTHENTHGITNRMTGGGTGRCLQTTEAGGMGEGWSDAMADWNEKTSSAVPDYVLGQYVINDAAGIRSHPYSTSATTNSLRYSSLSSLNEVHDIGEVWANILHNVYAALVAAHGWSATARTNPAGTEGNIVFLHLFIDALALQPCNPTFLTARTAWIQADTNRYAGANICTLWRAFASRGLGTNAVNHADDTSVPAGC